MLNTIIHHIIDSHKSLKFLLQTLFCNHSFNQFYKYINNMTYEKNYLVFYLETNIKCE